MIGYKALLEVEAVVTERPQKSIVTNPSSGTGGGASLLTARLAKMVGFGELRRMRVHSLR